MRASIYACMFVALCVVVAGHVLRPPPPAEAAETKWEHSIVHAYFRLPPVIKGEAKGAELPGPIAHLGAGGWEVCAVTPVPERKTFVVMLRRKK